MQKTILITGAARRIGAVIAKQCHQQGMNVVIHYHQSSQQAESLTDTLNQQRQHSATAIHADLSQQQHITTLINDTLKTFGQLDVLINNASSFYPTPLATATQQQWDELITSNLTAPYFLCQAAAPHLQKQQGLIINISDTHATTPLKNHNIYCIAKAGQNMLTKALAAELAPDIRVNAIAPGAILWPEQENALTEQNKQRVIDKIALKRQGEPQDIASAILYLINEATYTTGQILTIDGGRGL